MVLLLCVLLYTLAGCRFQRTHNHRCEGTSSGRFRHVPTSARNSISECECECVSVCERGCVCVSGWGCIGEPSIHVLTLSIHVYSFTTKMFTDCFKYSASIPVPLSSLSLSLSLFVSQSVPQVPIPVPERGSRWPLGGPLVHSWRTSTPVLPPYISDRQRGCGFAPTSLVRRVSPC